MYSNCVQRQQQAARGVVMDLPNRWVTAHGQAASSRLRNLARATSQWSQLGRQLSANGQLSPGNCDVQGLHAFTRRRRQRLMRRGLSS